MKNCLKILSVVLLITSSQLSEAQRVSSRSNIQSFSFFSKDSSFLVTTRGDFGKDQLANIIQELKFPFKADTIIYPAQPTFSITSWAAKNIGLFLDPYTENAVNSDVSMKISGNSSIYIFGIARNVTINSNEPNALLTQTQEANNIEIHFTEGDLKYIKLRLLVKAFTADSITVDKLELPFISVYKRFEITNSTIDSINLYSTHLPDVIKLEDLDLSKLAGLFDLSRLQNKKNILLQIANVDLTKLNIPYDRFDFVIDTAKHSYEQTVILYQQLLKKLADAGLSEKYEKYNKQFLDYKYRKTGHRIVNFIAKYWWDYGYDKARVFYIACGMFVFFFLVNFLFLNFLKDTYWPGKFKDYDKYLEDDVDKGRHRGFFYLYKKAFGVLLYTAFLFWGLKLELKDLDLKNRGAIFLIILQYVLGVICLAYLANYVLSK